MAGWDFSPEEIRSALSSSQMLNASIDLTNACNLNCPYCFIEEKNSPRKIRRPDELTHEEISTIIRDLRESGARTINIVGAGEPTIDPHFEETVEQIHDLGMTTVLFTNGIRLAADHALLHLLYSRSVSVVLKYNSRDVHMQDLAAGSPGYTAKRDDALRLLIDNGFSAHRPTRLGLDILAFKGNFHELASIHRWCREENFFPICGEYIPTGRTANGTFNGLVALRTRSEADRMLAIDRFQPLTGTDRTRLLRDLAEIDHIVDEDGPIMRPHRFAYFGGSLCTQIVGLYIDILGNIWPCVARSMHSAGTMGSGLLGNVRRGDKPTDIWLNHPYMQQLRDNFTGGCPYKPELRMDASL